MIDRIVVWALSLKTRASEERGQDIMEYAIITGSIAVVLVGSLLLFTDNLDGWFEAMGDFFATLVPTT
jgi:Flp pilus assembly pilin Flp